MENFIAVGFSQRMLIACGPSHDWDGNDYAYKASLPFGFSQRMLIVCYPSHEWDGNDWEGKLIAVWL
ncbi:hypothetical protein [Mucilaginibacter sp. 44-25]|uniref:hypothetical protein n=1 Tax=Mucilaginibacter sp. 44-25 TaxID=1895794 RepID=UPI000959D278|nr:hypothetical protein [Mucilaginibacter sp. 44-25]OJW14949.1 MAG: hypothetical protein BGO48_12350 [Mucilaginibacter sp. 44-25]